MIRIVSMDKLVKAQDFTWAMAQVFIWSCCEPFVGIICACLPTYGPLLRRWWKILSSTNGHQSRNNSFSLNTNVRKNKARKEWKHLNDQDLQLRLDDELGLTNDISGAASGSFNTQQSENEGLAIHVQSEFSWVGTNHPVSG